MDNVPDRSVYQRSRQPSLTCVGPATTVADDIQQQRGTSAYLLNGGAKTATACTAGNRRKTNLNLNFSFASKPADQSQTAIH